jgi:hypothetical protein
VTTLAPRASSTASRPRRAPEVVHPFPAVSSSAVLAIGAGSSPAAWPMLALSRTSVSRRWDWCNGRSACRVGRGERSPESRLCVVAGNVFLARCLSRSRQSQAVTLGEFIVRALREAVAQAERTGDAPATGSPRDVRDRHRHSLRINTRMSAAGGRSWALRTCPDLDVGK